MAKEKLKPKFDPIWQSDYLDIRLKKLSRTTFIMRQMYRSYRNPETNLCSLSDWQIHHITGWHREAIKKARERLIALGEIIPTGYHSFAVKTFHQYQKTGTESVLPGKKEQHGKRATDGTETVPEQHGKRATDGTETVPFPSYPDITDTDIQIERFCKDCQNYKQKEKTCPVLLCALPPFTKATGCDNFKPKESEPVDAKP